MTSGAPTGADHQATADMDVSASATAGAARANGFMGHTWGEVGTDPFLWDGSGQAGVPGRSGLANLDAQDGLDFLSVAVILAHNHPSGVAEPSRADEAITRRLRDALALVDVRVLNHLIVGGSEITSFAERGLL
jgi:hypothetical protein